MANPQTKEKAFETCLEEFLLSEAGGYAKGDNRDYDAAAARRVRPGGGPVPGCVRRVREGVAAGNVEGGWRSCTRGTRPRS